MTDGWADVEAVDMKRATIRVDAPPMIEVSTMSDEHGPDPNWVHVDSAGHEHRTVDGRWPSLRLVSEPDYFVDEGDGYMEEYPGDSWFECVLCGERVTPGEVVVRSSAFPVHVLAGRPMVYIDDVPVHPDQMERLVERYRERLGGED